MATDRTERLLNLVICLLGTRRPVPRSALRSSVPGYVDAVSDDAFERMFERDKEELRLMGIPVETVVNVQGEVEGYLIDQEKYAMPPLGLDAAEIGVLGLAARVWNEAALASQAGAALRKIEAATGERTSAPSLIAGRSSGRDDLLPTLWEAIRSHRVVSFDYLARGRDEAEARLVEPWATVYRGGAWYVVGLSRERSEPRAFRLSRVVGGIDVRPDYFEPGHEVEVAALIEGLADPPTSGMAIVRLSSEAGARLRASARTRPDGLLEVDYVDDDTLIADVIEAGGDIIEPAESARRLRASLIRVRDLHGAPHA